MLLNAELLLYYQRCHRRAFLDVYGDPQQKEPRSDFLLKLNQDSYAHRQAVLAEFTPQKPDYPAGNWMAGMQATLELMRDGVECIDRGVLLTQWADDWLLLSLPDLLVKQPGESDFGNWIYVPYNIRLSKRSKLEYQIASAFDAQVLSAVQGAWPDTAWLLLRKRSPFPVNLEQRVPEMHQILGDCIAMLRDRHAPDVFISRQRCNLCPWYTSCYTVAQQQSHLSLIPGVTPSRYQHLQNERVTTLEALSKLSVERLTALMGTEAAQQLVWQVQSTLNDRPIPFHSKLQRQNSKLADLFFKTPWQAPIEIHFDLEAEPELDIDFMFGVFVIDRREKKQRFYALIAEKPEDEIQVWQQFLQLIWAYPDAPIFHFCDYEVKTIAKFAQRYGTPEYLWKPLLPRFVDIHWWITQTAVLPVESYALKSIARWLGFTWRNSSANGAQCICWYNQWLETGDRTYLDAIIDYNEDDCRATYVVKEWLFVFLQAQLESAIAT
jgi:predicted RecB family nuclease